jgi:hypothetical protein
LSALQVADGEIERELWDEVIKSTSPHPGGLWPGTATAVLKRLAGLSLLVKGTQPATSFLYGWLVPRLLAFPAPLSDRKEAIRSALPQGSPDPRVVAVLAAHGIEGDQ